MSYDVVVVGSGFSAIALTINLLRNLPRSASIAVIGDDPGFGRGTAYRTELYLHRLNVPAARMSVFPDRPNDFLDWLKARGRAVFAEDFASRADYGLYLRDTLAAEMRPRERRANVDFIKAKAIACVRTQGGTLSFTLENGSRLIADRAILALGVGNADLPSCFKGGDSSLRKRIIRNPWRLGWLSRVGVNDEICILGSGLTMVDQVLSLRAHGHRGAIHVLSRRGLVPQAHRRLRSAPQPADLPESRRISALLKTLRQQAGASDDWRAVVDGLRPETQALWHDLPEEEKRRFLRHGLAWWNVHRHRIAPDVADRFEALTADGTVTVHAGYLQAVNEEKGRCVMAFRPRGRQGQAAFAVDWVINCTGMERAGIAHSPLLQSMHECGLISLDRLGLGIQVDGNSHVLAETGVECADIYAVGALTAGRFWEITAVPDIRAQAQAIGLKIGVELAESDLAVACSA